MRPFHTESRFWEPELRPYLIGFLIIGKNHGILARYFYKLSQIIHIIMIRKTGSFTGIASLIVLMVWGTTLRIEAQGSKFGVKGGLNMSYLAVDDADRNRILPGFQIGILREMMLNRTVSIQPEILYTVKGTRTVYDEEILGFEIVDGTTKLGLHYIEIPVYLKLNLADFFNLHLGPYFGILMFSNMETDAEILGFVDLDSVDEIDRDQFNKLDAGLSAGIGFSMDPLFFGFNYGLGLRQVANQNQNLAPLLGDAAHSSFQVYAGLTF